MKWMAQPVSVLNREQTLAMLKAGWPTDNLDKWRIKSQWLCDELNAMEKDGFVYNAQALHRIEKQESVGPFDENGSVLSILIYNAQGYRREDKARAEGFAPLTPELVRSALDAKKRIEILGENMLGGQVRVEGYRPFITADGAAYVIAPRKRNKGLRADGQVAARIIV